MSQQPPTRKRQRGRILTDKGWEKLQVAMERYQEENDVKLTNEKLAEMANLGILAISKILNREKGVDKSSLDNIFRAFSLKIARNDWNYPEKSQLDSPSALSIDTDTDFYVERPLIEPRCYREILLSGAVLRIKAPWQMGKTSLSNKILQYAQRQGYLTVALSFGMVDKEFFTNLDKFLRWFCAHISKELHKLGLELQQPSNLEDYWDNTFGSKHSCQDYFENNLLAQIPHPLVLSLDDVDLVYTNPTIADDFFDLLRYWHEETKRRPVWSKLRLILAYSRRIHISNPNQSPFNIGLLIDLPELEREEIRNLAQQYGLTWDNDEVEQLMKMVGGHPYLVQEALKNISGQYITLEKLLETASRGTVIYHGHLQNLSSCLYENKSLRVAMKNVVDADETDSVRLTWEERQGLYRMGLVKLEGDCALPRCQLYRQYFQERLNFNE